MTTTSTEGWIATRGRVCDSGTYFYLNIKLGAKSSAVTVKARSDGTYLCLNPSCIADVGPRLLHFLDASGGCVHARFVRDVDLATAHQQDQPSQSSQPGSDDDA